MPKVDLRKLLDSLWKSLVVIVILALVAKISFGSSSPFNWSFKKMSGLEVAQEEQVQVEDKLKLDIENLPWFNTVRPLKSKDLQGKFVILDFWTFCCINCIHIIPTLKKVEAKFPDEVLVIGAHSPKFQNEKDELGLKNAILRYEIEHPVVQDENFTLWKQFSVRAWPTLVLISPTGEVLGQIAGEPDPDKLLDYVTKQVEEYRSKKLLDGRVSELIKHEKKEGFADNLLGLLLNKKDKDKMQASQLSFPAKIDFSKELKKFVIADSNNNRILIADQKGKIDSIIGSGKIAQDDGDFSRASFFRPQGVKFHGNSIYVADTENHLIRHIDLDSRQVTTIAGTGKQGGILADEANALEAAISSPWDLEIVGDKLYFANAGTHQLGVLYNAVAPILNKPSTGVKASEWKLDPSKVKVERFAGSGREGITDGPRKSAALAQPSGLWYAHLIGNDYNTKLGSDRKLFFVDSETSSLRAVDLESNLVETFVGTGLFDFGDQDGLSLKVIRNIKKIKPENVAQLQHPIGLAYGGNKVFVADSYNNKVKAMDLNSLELRSLKVQLELCEVPLDLLDDKKSDKSKEDADEQSVEAEEKQIEDLSNKLANQEDPTCLPSLLGEPAGLVPVAKADLGEEGEGYYLFVVDTNNNRILKHDLKSSQTEVFI